MIWINRPDVGKWVLRGKTTPKALITIYRGRYCYFTNINHGSCDKLSQAKNIVEELLNESA